MRSSSFNHDFDLDEAYDLEKRSSKGSKGKSVKSNEGRTTLDMKHQKDVEGYGDDHWRSAQSRGLDELERAGLLSLSRRSGLPSVVTILEAC